jgi:hypothetical protein
MNFYEVRDETNYLIGFYTRKSLFKRLNVNDAATKKKIIDRLKDNYQAVYEAQSLQKVVFASGRKKDVPFTFEATIYLRTLE